MQWCLFAFALWNYIKCNSLLYDACLILTLYMIFSFTPFFGNQVTKTKARAGWDQATHLQVASLVLAFFPVLDLVMVLAVIPLVQTGTALMFPLLLTPCNFTSRKYSWQKGWTQCLILLPQLNIVLFYILTFISKSIIFEHCSFESTLFYSLIFLLFSSNQCYVSVTLDPYLSTCTFYSSSMPVLICIILLFLISHC